MKNCISFVCAQQQPESCHRSSLKIPYSTDNSASIAQMINVLYSKVCRLTGAATNLDQSQIVSLELISNPLISGGHSYDRSVIHTIQGSFQASAAKVPRSHWIQDDRRLGPSSPQIKSFLSLCRCMETHGEGRNLNIPRGATFNVWSRNLPYLRKQRSAVGNNYGCSRRCSRWK
jgi:hypothetical protein